MYVDIHPDLGYHRSKFGLKLTKIQSYLGVRAILLVHRKPILLMFR